ncbi:hypothetical protein VIGAN_08000400, partial [Vigna angularis var. angularis]
IYISLTIYIRRNCPHTNENYIKKYYMSQSIYTSLCCFFEFFHTKSVYQNRTIRAVFYRNFRLISPNLQGLMSKNFS